MWKEDGSKKVWTHKERNVIPWSPRVWVDEGKTLRILGEKKIIKNSTALNKASSNGILRTAKRGYYPFRKLRDGEHGWGKTTRKGQLGTRGAGARGSELWFSPFFLSQYTWCGRLYYCSLWKDCTSPTHCMAAWILPVEGLYIPTLLN